MINGNSGVSGQAMMRPCPAASLGFVRTRWESALAVGRVTSALALKGRGSPLRSDVKPYRKDRRAPVIAVTWKGDKISYA